jgi:1-acyl-sn-glycerol-3-phosphate acyltransferase
MFPSSVRRVIVLDATSATGYYAVESLALSPAVPKGATIVAAAWGRVSPQEAETATTHRMLLDLKADPDLKTPVVVLESSKGLHVNAASDVLVYVTRLFDVNVILETVGKAAPPPLVLVTADDAHMGALGALGTTLLKWRLVSVRAQHFGPPTCARLRNGRVLPEFVGPLENFALGVALGVTRYFAVNASQTADIAPIDVALHAGFSALSLCFSGTFPTSPKNPNHVVLNIFANAEQALVWGMVAEYVLDYYGRFGREIAKKIPGDAFNQDPTLAFNAHFADLWNYGLSLQTPLEMYRQRTARLTKSYLSKYPHSTTAERMTVALREIDSSLDGVTKHTPSKRVSYDNNTYQMLLRMLSMSRHHVAAFQAVDLNCVRWEAYVKRVSVRVLYFLASRLMNHHEPLHLPTPVPTYTNDFVFQGETRAPAPNLPLRRVFDDVHMLLRGGQQPNGMPVSLVPGGSQRTFFGILSQPHVQQLITRLANEQYLSRDDVEARAVKILRQIGDRINHPNARTLAYAIRKVMKTVYTRVDINPGAYETLFKAFRTPRTAVVLLPSHRSYMDFIVLSYAMLVMGFPLPHICAGEDFLRLGGIADMLRGSGAFFMRRSFKGDELYAALFKEYVRQLVRRSECIEFFLEGTRSRTQKTMGPKFGMLKIVTDAYLEPQTEINDVLFVPISLSYEKVLEGNVYADELLGIPKPPETTMNLMRSATLLQQKFGSFNVNFAQPISLAEFSKDPDQTPHGFARRLETTTPVTTPASAPKAAVKAAVKKPSPEITAPEAATATKPVKAASFTPDKVLQRVGWRVTYELQRHLVVTPTALTAAVVLHMFDHTALKAEGIPMAAVASRVEWLRSKVLAAGGLMNHEYATFDGLSLLTYAVQHLQPHVTISPLSRVYMASTSIATYMVLSLYTNQLVHLFGEEGTLAVAATSLAPPCGPESTALPTPANGNGADALQGADISAKPISSGQSVSAEDDKEQFSAKFAVSRAALAKQTAEVRRLMWHELPDFQAPNPVHPGLAFDACVQRLAGEGCVAGRDTLICAPNHYYGFVSQLIYPCIEAYYVLHIALSVLPTVRSLPEAALLNLAHKLALHLYNAKLVQFVSCSNKETLRNALVRSVEAHTARVEKGARGAMVVLSPTAAANGAALLKDRIRELNQLRQKPSSVEDIERSVKGAIDLHAATAKLPVPPATLKKSKL